MENGPIRGVCALINVCSEVVCYDIMGGTCDSGLRSLRWIALSWWSRTVSTNSDLCFLVRCYSDDAGKEREKLA